MCHARSIVNEVAVTFNFVQDIFMHEINRNQQHNSEYCEDQVFPHENSAAVYVDAVRWLQNHWFAASVVLHSTLHY